MQKWHRYNSAYFFEKRLGKTKNNLRCIIGKGKNMRVKIALAGNPNSGKTTLFNALTGSNQFVGNWPGVTVEKKEGKIKGYTTKGEEAILVDLPEIGRAHV